MSVLRSTLGFGLLLPPPTRRPIRRHELRGVGAPKLRQIVVAYGLAALALGLVLLALALPGPQVSNAFDQSNAASRVQQRLELHSGAPLLPMPVP
jgi:hypothetical protein